MKRATSSNVTKAATRGQLMIEVNAGSRAHAFDRSLDVDVRGEEVDCILIDAAQRARVAQGFATAIQPRPLS